MRRRLSEREGLAIGSCVGVMAAISGIEMRHLQGPLRTISIVPSMVYRVPSMAISGRRNPGPPISNAFQVAFGVYAPKAFNPAKRDAKEAANKRSPIHQSILDL